MYFHHVVGTGSYTTSTTNMYHKDRFHVPDVKTYVSGKEKEVKGVNNSFTHSKRTNVATPKIEKKR